jgi:hypothetical protein
MQNEVCVNSKGKGKNGYRTRAAAEKVAKRRGVHVSVYKCPFHDHWCLTSEVQTKKAPPSAAKLRRQLADRAALIASQQRRMDAADAALAKQTAKAEEMQRQAQRDHDEIMDYIRRETDRAFAA